MTSKQEPSLEEFLATIVPTPSAEDEYIEVRTVKDGKAHQEWCRSAAQAAAVIQEACGDGCNVYYSVGLRRGRQGTNEATCRLQVIPADVDFDAYPDGEQGARQAAIALGLAPSAVVNSGGGWHLYFLLTEPVGPDLYPRTRAIGRKLAQALSPNGRSLDAIDDPARVLRVPGTSNYKYDPPRPVTIHRWHQERHYTLEQLETAFGRGGFDSVEVPLYTLLEDDAKIRKGNRHKVLMSWLGLAQRQGRPADDIATELGVLNATHCEEPLTDAQLGELLRSAAKWPAAEAINLTDLGNAKRYVREHGEDLRFCHPWGRWLVWKGTHWSADDTGEVERRAKDVPRLLLREAAKSKDDAKREKLAKWALATEASGKQQALISLARSELGIPILPAALDADPCLFNVPNGTLDLCNGKLRPHSPTDYITKLAPVRYDAQALCPNFLKALGEIFDGNADIISYVQRSLGRALTGDVSEQQVDIWYGRGDNGKSFLFGLMLKMWGSYGLMCPPGLLVAPKSERHPAELATLHGIRLAVSVEVGEGHRLYEDRLKQLTGTDRISARRMREDWWEFEPSHHLFLATNHRPTIRGTDFAIWKRIRLVPFTVTIPPEKQDKYLGQRLWDKEASGILNWLVEGCLAWRREGLAAPKEVQVATAEYRDFMDSLAAFLEECFELDPEAFMPFDDIYTAYVDWAKSVGEYVQSSRMLAMRLDEKGYHPTRQEHIRGRVGLKLKDKIAEKQNLPTEVGEPSEGIKLL
jgi:putative DNA primase/helicase